MENRKVMAIAMLAFVIGLAAYNVAGSSVQDITELITNYTVNITGQPAIMHYVTFIAGTNISLSQDTGNHTIIINSTGGGAGGSTYYNYSNFTNWFGEVFLNKISLNNTYYPTNTYINLNSSVVINKSQFSVMSPSYTSYLDISRDNLTLFYNNNENISSLELKTKDASGYHYTQLYAGNALSYSYLYINPYDIYFQTIPGNKITMQTNTTETKIDTVIVKNNIVSEKLRGSDQYVKINTSGELYKVTPVVNITYNFTNLSRGFDIKYWNNYSNAIIVHPRVYVVRGANYCEVAMKINNNTIIMAQAPVWNSAIWKEAESDFIISSGSYYSFTKTQNVGCTEVIAAIYEHNMTLQP